MEKLTEPYKQSDYLYQAKYNDRYIQHLERLSKDKSLLNKRNASIAKDTLDGIEKIKNQNYFVRQCIIEQKENE